MEQLETISVVPHKERHDDAKPASPSWFVAKINPVSRFIGALILCIPHVRDAGRGLRVRGTRIGGVVALDWRRRSMDGAS